MKSSNLIADQVQTDGRRHITERHISDADKEINVSYLAEASADASAVMLARVTQLEAQLLAENESRLKQVLIETVIRKELIYFASLSDATIKTRLSLTDAELAVFREMKA